MIFGGSIPIVSEPESCPICGKGPFRKKFLVNGYVIYQCQACTGAFTYPRLEVNDVPEIYGNEYSKIYQGTPSHGQAYVDWRYQRVVKL